MHPPVPGGLMLSIFDAVVRTAREDWPWNFRTVISEMRFSLTRKTNARCKNLRRLLRVS